MNAAQKLLLSLIKAACFGKKEEALPAPGSGTDPRGEELWREVYREAMAQRIAGLAIDGIEACGLADESGLSSAANGTWRESGMRNMAWYIRYLHAQNELTALLDGEGIPFAVLKGLAAAVYYPAPRARMMGDIDFIVPRELFDKCREIMTAAGYEYVPANEDYARHVAFVKNGITFELHHHFSHDDRDVETFIDRGLANAVRVSVDGAEISMLPDEDNGIVLIDHIRNHLKNGLGLRQLIDWMMYVEKVVDDDFWESGFGDALASVNMDRLAKVAAGTCVMFLGLDGSRRSWCAGADKELCERLMELLLEYGNFGRKQGAGGKVQNVISGMKKEGVFRRLQRAGEANWKAYKKHRWLKPFAWIYQSGRYLRQGVSTGRSPGTLRKDMKQSVKRDRLMKELGAI